MLKRFLYIILALIVVFGALFGYKFYQIHMAIKKFHSMPKPVQTITSVTARYSNWTPTLQGIGSLYAINGTAITAQSSGQVIAIYFKSGQYVKKGQLLVQLEDAADKAQLNSIKATLANSKFMYEHNLRLYTKFPDHGGLSEAAIVKDRTTYLNNKALVEQQQQVINYKQIRAPFNGKLGIRQVNMGQYVSPTASDFGSEAGFKIATIQQINPLQVRFYLPAKTLSKVKVGLPMLINVNAYPKKNFHGTINAISSQIDVDTRMAYIEGRIANPERKLLPGMFANVTVTLPTYKHVIVLPQTAITYTAYGDTVYLIKKEGVNKQGKPVLRAIAKNVTLGATRGNRIIVTTGVKPGDLIVSSGQNKLYSGVLVAINNSTPMK